jgi:hypothetical protein
MSRRSNFPNPPSPAPITPMVYVRDKTVWQSKVVTRELARPLDEEDLNALGKEGWELAAVLSHSGAAHFYFKRMKD